LAKSLKDVGLFRRLTGDAGQKLSSEEFYRTLPVPKVEFGVVAGDAGQSITFKEPNDGIVSVESTKLTGMRDWIILHHTHTFLMNCEDTAECCVRFIRNGRLTAGAGEP
jgi:hypothetical protein